MSEPKRHLEVWEVVEQKLTEASMWLSICVTSATEARHPRKEEFVRRWSLLAANLGQAQIDLERLAAEQQGAGFP